MKRVSLLFPSREIPGKFTNLVVIRISKQVVTLLVYGKSKAISLKFLLPQKGATRFPCLSHQRKNSEFRDEFGDLPPDQTKTVTRMESAFHNPPQTHNEPLDRFLAHLIEEMRRMESDVNTSFEAITDNCTRRIQFHGISIRNKMYPEVIATARRQMRRKIREIDRQWTWSIPNRFEIDLNIIVMREHIDDHERGVALTSFREIAHRRDDFLASRSLEYLEKIMDAAKIVKEGAGPRGKQRRHGKFRVMQVDSADLATCTICWDEVRPGEIATKLGCGHQFHKECLAPWRARKDTCPMCRGEMGKVKYYYCSSY
jgi:hypothetical protein